MSEKFARAFSKPTGALVLEDGTVLEGRGIGKLGEAVGEVCFNTSMTGYQEILTDPSYCGQLITMTYPHIGNYGINEEDVESNKIHAAGFIVREENVVPSNFRSTQSLGEYLRDQKIVGIQKIDTRMLTRILRDEGAMNGIISTVDLDDDSLLQKVKIAPSMDGLDLAKVVTCDKSYKWSKGKYKIAAIDFGIKHNILRLLDSQGCEVTVFTDANAAAEILNINPDGIFLSNGPGDPAAVTYGIKTVKELLGKKPLFGICLGHQILALALGGETYKLKFGHHGANHPVKDLRSGKVTISSQNHGFAIDPDTLPNDLSVSHVNLIDGTVEGIEHKNLPVMGIQFHSEASPGPLDNTYLFDRFIEKIKEEQNG